MVLGKALKIGAILGAAGLVVNAMNKGHDNAANQSQAQTQQQQPSPVPWSDASGYLHQPYCNGQCAHRCNAAGNPRFAGEHVIHRDQQETRALPERDGKAAVRDDVPPVYTKS